MILLKMVTLQNYLLVASAHKTFFYDVQSLSVKCYYNFRNFLCVTVPFGSVKTILAETIFILLTPSCKRIVLKVIVPLIATKILGTYK